VKQVSTVGLDLAKHVFQAHGADAEGSPVFNRRLRRSEVLRFFEKLPPCPMARRSQHSSWPVNLDKDCGFLLNARNRTAEIMRRRAGFIFREPLL